MSRKIFILLLIVLAFAAGRALAETKAYSTSISRQFIVYGADVQVRGTLCDLAETTKANLLHLLDLPDRWRTPLVINLEYPQANVPELPPFDLDISQTGAGLKLQLNLLVRGDLSGPEVQRQLLRVILIEMMYRSRTNVAAGTHYTAPPDWLLDGILLSMPRRDDEEAVQLLRAAVADNQIEPLETIVRQRRDLLDSPSREIHDAYAMALVQLLIDAPAGRQKLVQYVADLPDAPNDPYADLRAHFPTILGGAAEKWWSLSVAHVSTRDRYEILSANETARRLDQLLRISIPNPSGESSRDYSLGEYAAFLKVAAARGALRGLSQQLLLLAARAHPAYRPVVQEYYGIAAQLARGKTHRITQRLARVKSYRAVVTAQCREIDDYMNWYQATQISSISGAFSDLLQTARPDPPPPRRRDPISVYLDSIEAQMK